MQYFVRQTFASEDPFPLVAAPGVTPEDPIQSVQATQEDSPDTEDKPVTNPYTSVDNRKLHLICIFVLLNSQGKVITIIMAHGYLFYIITIAIRIKQF